MGDSRFAPWLAAAAVAGIAAPVRAGNAGHSPTPVVWEADACMTIVDRATDPVVEFSYAIPFEDTEVTTDEVADSRTHQFFAVCESRGWFVFLPPWVSEADVDAAAAIGLVEPADLDREDILESSSRWDGCWTRITGDEERRPITFDAARDVVRWDTTAVPAGVYVVEGYTHEPPKSQWRSRPGVFKLVDGAGADAGGPAVAILNPESVVAPGEQTIIEGCIDAGEGATWTASWAVIDDPLAWADFAGPEPVSGASFAVPFVPPVAARGASVAIRVVVEDAAGRSSFGYMLEPLIVTDGSAGGSTGPAVETGTVATEASGTTASLDGGDGDDCACRSGRAGSTAYWLVLLALIGRRRRARR